MLCCRSLHSQQADGTGTEPGEQVTAYQQPGLDYSLQRRDTTPVYPHMITTTQHIQSEYGKCDNASCLQDVEKDVFWGASIQESVYHAHGCDDGWQRGCKAYPRLWTGVEAAFTFSELWGRKSIWRNLYWTKLVLNLKHMGQKSALSLESPALLCIFLQVRCMLTSRIKTLWEKM